MNGRSGTWWARVRGMFARGPLVAEVADEVEAHIALMVDDLIERGVPREEAVRRARREFGNPLATRERALQAWQFPRLETFAQDVRYGVRGIRRSPALSGIILATLALGIGATTAIFSVVYTVLLRPLPYPEPDRLVRVGESAGAADGISVTWGNYRAWSRQNRSFEGLAAFARGAERTLTHDGSARVVRGWLVTHGFFPLAGWAASEGRLFLADDDRPGAPPTIVISDAFRRTLPHASDPVGREIVLDGDAYHVIGVLEPGVELLDSDVDFYLPLGTFFSDADPRARHGSIRALGRLREGVELDEARADLNAILARLAQADPGPEDDHRAYLEPLASAVRGDLGRTLWLLLGAVALVLLLACANVASLLLARGASRRRELAVRAAIGAGRGRLTRQLITETLVTATLGGVLGILLAKLALAWLVSSAPADLPRLSEIGLDLPMLAFAAAITLLAGLVAGIAPVATGRNDAVEALKEESSRTGPGRAGQRLRGGMVVAEVAISLVLAFAATLLIRSLALSQDAGAGFDESNLLALELRLPGDRYPDGEARRSFFEGLSARLSAQPWVESAAAMGCPPTWGNCGDWWYWIEGRPAPPEAEVPVAQFDVIQAGAFAVLGLPMLAGREFGPETMDTGPVAIVNETLASRWWPTAGEAVGQVLDIGGPYQDGSHARIVGVVADAAQAAPDVPPSPEFWIPFESQPRARMTMVIRTANDPAAALLPVQSLVRELDPSLPIWALRTFEDAVADTLSARRFTTWLLTLFATLALVLATVGVYGVLQQWVNARRPEIAIRMVLGAGRRPILGWVARHALLLIGIGVTLGLAGVLAAVRWLESVVFGISASDLPTLVGVTLGVIVIASVAACIPLVRATAVDARTEIARG